jgi:hypothetical protein
MTITHDTPTAPAHHLHALTARSGLGVPGVSRIAAMRAVLAAEQWHARIGDRPRDELHMVVLDARDA